MSLQEFISVINAEAEHHLALHCRTDLAYSTKAKNKKGKPLLSQCISSKSKANDDSKDN
jgi:hypothetical protein